MRLNEVKVGDVVITGDSYGMSPCVCVKASYFNENYQFNCVDFLNLTTGDVYASGGKTPAYEDYCQLIERLEERELERILKVWNYTGEEV